ncbi:hypothetical protein DPMN_021575 [Dreissena polymorpha]|nr:hypothetical protein DPMN_021575 [Dreissena polymorpha]
MECFHFGSQSEGTTTPGLLSDIDILYGRNEVNIMTDWEYWKAEMMNLLMLKCDNSPPQQYLLQLIMSDRPVPETRLFDKMLVKNGPEQLLFSSEQFKNSVERIHENRGTIKKEGPSVSFLTEWDIVHAFYTREPLPEIQHWIGRCQGRRWPSPKLLEAARVTACFLVPAGHPDSVYRNEEWRLSPNLVERMLMFSFNTAQIKCYVTSLFSFIVNDAITSFHCKTIMFYTIERTLPSMWKEHNLMILVILCMQTLRKWLRDGVLPHFIIPDVNLFDGKITRRQQIRLLQYVDSMIKNNLQDIFLIDIDNFGQLLCAGSLYDIGHGREVGRSLNKGIYLLLEFNRVKQLLNRLTAYSGEHLLVKTEHNIIRSLLTLFGLCKNPSLKPVALEITEHLYAIRTSLRTSTSIRSGRLCFGDILACFQYSLRTDVASTRLKMASALYCGGHLRSAAVVLEDVERRYHINVKAVCAVRCQPSDSDLQMFAKTMLDHCDRSLSEPPFAFCVKFLRQEMSCAPFILWFEMIRNMTEEEVAQRNYTEKQWMDYAEVDARSFLHYLQYLTYGGLGERKRQLQALDELGLYVCETGHQNNQYNMYHHETAINLLGHCYEMERHYKGALHYYETSLRRCKINNAANWHLRRVLSLICG